MVMEGNEFYMNGERLDILQTRWDRAAQQVVYLARDGHGTEWTITLPVLRAVEGRETFFRGTKNVNLSNLVGEHGPVLTDTESIKKFVDGLKSGSLKISGLFDVPLYDPPKADEIVVIDSPSVARGTAYAIPGRLADPTQPDGMETMDAWFRRCFKIQMDQVLADSINAVTGESLSGEEAAEIIEQRREQERWEDDGGDSRVS